MDISLDRGRRRRRISPVVRWRIGGGLVVGGDLLE